MYKSNYTNSVAAIFDDHLIFSESFATILEKFGFFETTKVLESEDDLFSFFRTTQLFQPFLFLDYFIPGSNVLYLIGDVRRLCPSVKIIIVSSLSNAVIAKKVMLQKPNAILSKVAKIPEIIDCINTINQKGTYISPYIQKVLIEAGEEQKQPFTAKELEILNYIVSGKSIEYIAEALNISHHTVITHRRNMMRKSGCRSSIELLSYALSSSIVSIENFS